MHSFLLTGFFSFFVEYLCRDKGIGLERPFKVGKWNTSKNANTLFYYKANVTAPPRLNHFFSEASSRLSGECAATLCTLCQDSNVCCCCQFNPHEVFQSTKGWVVFFLQIRKIDMCYAFQLIAFVLFFWTNEKLSSSAKVSHACAAFNYCQRGALIKKSVLLPAIY